MHRCLLIDEVLEDIFSRLGRQTLCSLARTCRAFHEPATAIIWQHLMGLWPILRLLPGATATYWVEPRKAIPEADEHERPPIVVTRPLTLEEWLIFKRLSHRVRDIHVTITQIPRHYSITPESLSFLLHPPGNESLKSLFPNVQHLFFRCQGLSLSEAINYEGCFLTLLRILIRPQLSTLQLLLNGRFCASLNASGILSLCSNIRTLHTSTVSLETEQGTRVFILPIISGFQSLETIRIHDVSWELLASLAQMKMLRRLHIDFHELGPSLPLTNDAFAELRHLSTHIISIELSLTFYRWMSLSELRSLIILTTDFDRDDYSEDLEELLTLIPLRGPFLETIHVNLALARPRQPRHWVLTKSILTPYLSLRNLEVLDITLASGSYSPQFTDDDLTQMAQSWPLLKELHLRTYTSGWVLPTGLSLRGIIALIQHCPKIEEFSLVFNAVEISNTVCYPDGSLVQNTSVRSMQVGNSPISSPEDVARYLRLLMPGLHVVSTCDKMDSTHKMHWKTVSALLA
ncbi:hypothetical protein EDC04DRAFT_3106434 [Pisolithus marmoratus]|nr:hypothetical protein EDC04DRAFT_3106434 [Pisolithus marmoratus]